MQKDGSKYFAPRIFPPPPPRRRVNRPKFQLFHNIVMLHIKLKRITNAATCWQIFFAQTPPPPSDHGFGSIDKNSNCSKHIAYQNNGNHEVQQHDGKSFARRPSPLPKFPRGWGQKVQIQHYQNMVMLHIKFIGIR